MMRIALLTGIVVAGVMTMAWAQDAPKLLNPDLEVDTNSDGILDNWGRYISNGTARTAVDVEVKHAGKGSMRIEVDPDSRCTVSQTLAAPGPGTYTFGCWLKTKLPPGASATLYCQWLDAKNERIRVEPSTPPLLGNSDWTEVALAITPPEGAQRLLAIIVVACGKGEAGTAWADDAYLKVGSFPKAPPVAVKPGAPVTMEQPAQVIPDPVPPVYSRLKNLYRETPLVAGGKPQITIVAPAAYAREAAQLQAAIAQITGVKVPIVSDRDPAAAVPLAGHLIALGNRSTNRTLSALYDRSYCFTDVKYPGPGGSEVRSLHNPFGNGKNVLIVGGSDAAGVTAATEGLLSRLRQAGGGQGQLTVGWLMDIKLAAGYTLPADVKDYPIWEASRMYGSSGYFGWNIISKHMAAYYMTGREQDLREFLRLSFPDAEAMKQIDAQDGERIENKKDPLAGPYHYAAQMMIVLWDLIEESPQLTDEQRLKVTNALSRQLTHRVPEGVYNRTGPSAFVGDRHGDWAAFALYALGRYFEKDYPGPIWQRCLFAGDQYFKALYTTYWMAGNNDHLFWFTSYYDPILNYILFSGDRTSLANGNLRKAFRTQEILSTGLENDWGLTASSLSMLNKAAYLFNDGRWLCYREHARQDETIFRLGQSFWPGPELTPVPPADLTGKWTFQDMPEAMWKARNTGLPLAQSFKWGSYRSEVGPGGDYLLLDGYNGGGRNPYHTFDILELRLNGATLLKGYLNQVLASADGLVEPAVAMDCALLHHDVLGQSVVAVGEVPKAAYNTWRRNIVQRVGRYALVVDDLAFRTDSDNIKLETTWTMPGAAWNAKINGLRMRTASAALPPGWLNFRALDSTRLTCGPGTAAELLSKLSSLDIVLLKATAPGAWLELPFAVEQAVSGEVYVDLLSYNDRGQARLSLDGKVIGPDTDMYAEGVATTRVSLGQQALAAGEHRLRLEIVGQRAAARGFLAGLIGVRVRPAGAPASAPGQVYELHPCDALNATQAGGTTTCEWLGSARQGQHRRFFSLLAANPTVSDTALTCARLADNAAALALPEPALAACGSYQGLQGDLVILAATHLYGRALQQAGLAAPLIKASAPVEADWDFATGKLAVASDQPVTLALALANAAAVKLDGRPLPGATAEGLTAVTLPAGRHELAGATPAPSLLQGLQPALQAQVEQGRQQLAAAQAALAKPAAPTAPEIKSVASAALGGKPAEAEVLPGGQLAAAVGKNVIIMDATGKEVRRLTLAGEVRVLHWWQQPGLLLVGCVDEKVVAFDAQGNRQWEFTSVMDPEVYEAGKQYWFKSAHPGIYGLDTGVFDGGQERLFVGSACTLEILDTKGALVKRLPIFWGPGRKFLLVDTADGSRNLLIARWHNDGLALAVVNSKTLTRTGTGYDGVPAGHTYVTGWDCMNREDNFVTDLNGDGKTEVVSAINGAWNRITVYSREGAPLYNAQFGPGNNEARANLRQMIVADLSGDGKQEIIVGLSSGLVVALDSQCRKVWARRLPSPPTVLGALGEKSPKLLVGCQDGTIALLDGQGVITGLGQVKGRPALLRLLSTATGPLGMILTDTGEVSGFTP